MNLDAYGAGKVNINNLNEEDSDEQDLDEFNLDSHTNAQARVLSKIAGFEKKTDAIIDSLGDMAVSNAFGSNIIAF